MAGKPTEATQHAVCSRQVQHAGVAGSQGAFSCITISTSCSCGTSCTKCFLLPGRGPVLLANPPTCQCCSMILAVSSARTAVELYTLLCRQGCSRDRWLPSAAACNSAEQALVHHQCSGAALLMPGCSSARMTLNGSAAPLHGRLNMLTACARQITYASKMTVELCMQ